MSLQFLIQSRRQVFFLSTYFKWFYMTLYLHHLSYNFKKGGEWHKRPNLRLVLSSKYPKYRWWTCYISIHAAAHVNYDTRTLHINMHWHKAIVCYSKHKNLIHHNLGMSHHPSHITRHMSLWVINPTLSQLNWISFRQWNNADMTNTSTLGCNHTVGVNTYRGTTTDSTSS